MWTQSRYALDFFEKYVPFWRMTSQDSLISSSGNAWCLGSNSEDAFVVYLKNGGTIDIDLPAASTFTVQWFDPRNGGNLQVGSVASISGGTSTSVGNAPYDTSQDWAVLLSAVVP